MKYFGTDLSPDDYYKYHSNDYVNNQEREIHSILEIYLNYIKNDVVDIGCGDGLVSKYLKNKNFNCIGIDRSPEMIKRFEKETQFKGYVLNFWDELPQAKTAIVAHSLHLCPKSRKWEFEWRLRQAEIETLIVTSPLKRAVNSLSFNLKDSIIIKSSKDKKSVFGYLFEVR